LAYVDAKPVDSEVPDLKATEQYFSVVGLMLYKMFLAYEFAVAILKPLDSIFTTVLFIILYKLVVACRATEQHFLWYCLLRSDVSDCGLEEVLNCNQ